MRNQTVLAVDDSGLSGTERLVAFELGIHSDRKGVVRMSQTEMATHVGVSRRTVATVFDRLENMGYLERLGHGRYRVSDEFEDDSTVVTIRPSAEAIAEGKRLQEIREPHQGIVYGKDGWPVLAEQVDGEWVPVQKGEWYE